MIQCPMILALDIGSSSVKASLARPGKIVGKIIRQGYPSRHQGPYAEIEPKEVLSAIISAIAELGPRVGSVDWVAMSVMSPSWVAMDKHGQPITPIVTHQDRRSVAIAHELENRIGKETFLKIAGNRPFPGGISSTTCAWFVRHHRSLMKRADLVGHLSTLIHRQLTGSRVTDPSNASYMGLYETTTMGGWNDALCQEVGINKECLPEIFPSGQIAGKVQGGNDWGLTAGTPVLAGLVDTSAAMILAGPRAGQMVNVSGSTDVLALCVSQPYPNEKLLTRALGIGKHWMEVSTIAAGGASLSWVHDQFFSEMPYPRFNKLLAKLARSPIRSDVKFDPYLAGDRMSIDQKSAAFTNLSLGTTRQMMLSAVIESLADASARRLPLLRRANRQIRKNVLTSGGVEKHVADIIHRNWPGQWIFHNETQAMLRGLSCMEPKVR